MTTKKTGLSILIFLSLLLSGCAQNGTQSSATPLPPQITVESLPSSLPATQTATADPGPTATSLPLPTIQTGCTDSALYVEDVSIPDNTNLKAGEAFTKTWRLRNTGKCIWNVRYALVYVGGEQMSGAITTPLSETSPGKTLDISINLIAPEKDGQYTGLYELRTPQGRAIQIGAVSSIWVKITVGKVNPAPAANAGQAAGTSQSQATQAAPGAQTTCSPQQNSGYTAEILALINAARAQDKLAALNLNEQLNMAAQGHSDDMGCNNFADHTGSDGSSIHARLVAAGYTPSYSEEIIFSGGTPQSAFDWWINDKTHRDAILNPNVQDIGIGYTYVPGSAYGGYFTVDFAAP